MQLEVKDRGRSAGLRIRNVRVANTASIDQIYTAAADHTERPIPHHDGCGLVDADAELARVQRHGADPAADPSAFRKMLVDDDV